jgi:hypothetical protein
LLYAALSGQPVSRSFVTYTAAAAALPGESRNGELAGEVGRLAVLAGETGQVRGGVVQAGEGLVELAARPARVGGARQHEGSTFGDVAEPGFFQRPPQSAPVAAFAAASCSARSRSACSARTLSRCAAWRQLSPQYLAGRPVAGRFKGWPPRRGLRRRLGHLAPVAL